MRGHRTVEKFRQTQDTLSALRRSGTDFVRESVDGLWGGSGNPIVGGCDDLCASRSAILIGAKRSELYRIRVEVHQKRLEAVTTSTKCWGVPSLHSRHERHVRDFYDLPFFDALVAFLTEDPSFFAGNAKRIKDTNLRLARTLEQGDLLVLIVLKIAVREISVVFCGFFVVDRFLVEVFRLGLCKVPKEHFENGIVRLCASGIECGGDSRSSK